MRHKKWSKTRLPRDCLRTDKLWTNNDLKFIRKLHLRITSDGKQVAVESLDHGAEKRNRSNKVEKEYRKRRMQRLKKKRALGAMWEEPVRREVRYALVCKKKHDRAVERSEMAKELRRGRCGNASPHRGLQESPAVMAVVGKIRRERVAGNLRSEQKSTL